MNLNMKWLTRVRPQVLVILLIFGMGLGISLFKEAYEVSSGIIVAMAAGMTKLIESE